MKNSIESLEPKVLWKYFAGISAIPHGSKNEQALREWIRRKAEEHKLEVKQDQAGSLVVRIPGSEGHEKAETVVLQGHLDMVCEKNSDVAFDFAKDPLKLVAKDGWVKAEGTTLGADNGIGVAAALALMDSPEVVHGPLELLFTIDEETGLTGAAALEPGFVTGKTLINLDSEEDNTFFIGCAGGADAHFDLPLAWMDPPAGSKGIRIAITGLAGGHSGLNIVENRGNAIRLLAKILVRAGRTADLNLASIEGGSKHNAIPREAFAVLCGGPDLLDILDKAAQDELRLFKEEFEKTDPEGKVTVATAPTPPKVLDVGTRDRLLGTLLSVPHGVLAMSRDIPGLVETSTNLAIVLIDGNVAKVHMSSRSSVASALSRTNWQIAAVAGLAGATVTMGNAYPGWKPNMASLLLNIARETYRRLRKSEPVITAIHAGLECGIIGERFPGMDMISFGPTIQGAHSPDERVEIASVERFWKLLKGLLESLA